MRLKFFFLFLLIGNCISKEIEIHILYEALCPDCVQFITKQLHPHFHILDPYIKLNLIPFGKAEYFIAKDNVTINFKCQHDEEECIANKFQACVLEQTHNQIQQVNYVNCIMSKSDPSDRESNEDCINRFNYSIRHMEFCVDSDIGDRMLRIMGQITKALKDPLEFVPTIIFDYEYDADLQKIALEQFSALVCTKLMRKPKECYDVIGLLKIDGNKYRKVYILD